MHARSQYHLRGVANRLISHDRSHCCHVAVAALLHSAQVEMALIARSIASYMYYLCWKNLRIDSSHCNFD